jgi:L-ascorbate metabolism protein UlaG (beta-lactamase superfamily)
MEMKRGQELIDDINACRPAVGEAAFWWIGQHSFIVKLGEVVCYIDPFLSELSGRQVPPFLKPSEVTNSTIVLGTHDHADHIDRGALPGILAASPKAKVIIPQLLRQQVVDDLKLDERQVLGIDIDTPIDIAGLTINAVPAAQEFLERDEKTGLHPYLGFVVTGNDFCFYHAGDTCIYEGIWAILRRWKFDLAMLPINGRDAKRLKSGCIGNMTYQEAADLAGSLHIATTVPTHFEMFEANSADPQLFVDYMGVKYPRLHTFIPVHGRRTIVKSMARR